MDGAGVGPAPGTAPARPGRTTRPGPAGRPSRRAPAAPRARRRPHGRCRAAPAAVLPATPGRPPTGRRPRGRTPTSDRNAAGRERAAHVLGAVDEHERAGPVCVGVCVAVLVLGPRSPAASARTPATVLGVVRVDGPAVAGAVLAGARASDGSRAIPRTVQPSCSAARARVTSAVVRPERARPTTARWPSPGSQPDRRTTLPVRVVAEGEDEPRPVAPGRRGQVRGGGPPGELRQPRRGARDVAQRARGAAGRVDHEHCGVGPRRGSCRVISCRSVSGRPGSLRAARRSIRCVAGTRGPGRGAADQGQVRVGRCGDVCALQRHGWCGPEAQQSPARCRHRDVRRARDRRARPATRGGR